MIERVESIISRSLVSSSLVWWYVLYFGLFNPVWDTGYNPILDHSQGSQTKASTHWQDSSDRGTCTWSFRALTQTRRRIQKVECSYGVNYRALKCIYFLDWPRSLGRVEP